MIKSKNNLMKLGKETEFITLQIKMLLMQNYLLRMLLYINKKYIIKSQKVKILIELKKKNKSIKKNNL
jgi:hypothetical protein